MRYSIHIPVDPKPKARPRATRLGRVYTPKSSLDHEAAIRSSVIATLEANGVAVVPICRPCKLGLVFDMPSNAGGWRKKAAAAGVFYPVRRWDLDNMAKSVMDALNGVLWDDDHRIMVLTASKRETTSGGIGITVESISDAVMNRDEWKQRGQA